MPVDVSLVLSMEGEAYYPELKLEHRSRTHAIASTRFDSDVPLPYFSWAEYDIQAPGVRFDDIQSNGTSFVARNCESKSGRESMVAQIMGNMSVTSYGHCLQNTAVDMPFDKREVLRQHATHLAFENQCTEDYVSEKLWHTLQSGVIPAYYGAPNVASHAPDGSFVDVRRFDSMRSLAAHLTHIASNRTLYDLYHAWRARPLPEWFVRKYAFTHTHSECRVCQWAATT